MASGLSEPLPGCSVTQAGGGELSPCSSGGNCELPGTSLRRGPARGSLAPHWSHHGHWFWMIQELAQLGAWPRMLLRTGPAQPRAEASSLKTQGALAKLSPG